MTTNTYTGSSQHNTDAEFRAMGLALSNCLTAAGLATAGDTGQINWASVTRPVGNNTAAGYEIRYLNDSLHATKPCYIKIEYGAGQPLSAMSLWITVASATNGAGTVAGTTYFARLQITSWASPSAGTYPTFCCVLPGYMALAPWRRGYPTFPAFVSICRTVDAAGTPTSDGFYLYYLTQASTTMTRKTYITTELTDSDRFALVPGNITSTLSGGDVKVFRHFGFVGDNSTRCVPFFLSYLSADIGDEATFSVTPIGVTARTYLTLGGAIAPVSVAAGGPTVARLCMQWE